MMEMLRHFAILQSLYYDVWGAKLRPWQVCIARILSRSARVSDPADDIDRRSPAFPQLFNSVQISSSILHYDGA